MELTLVIILIWSFKLTKGVHADESLSFSVPIDYSIVPTPSFWHGTIELKLLEKEMRFRFYLNKPQGLLFYAIDDSYQSLWLEFDMSNIVVNYFNFKTELIEQYKYDIKNLCSLVQVEDSVLNLTLSLSKNVLFMTCNNKDEKIFYSPNFDLYNNVSIVPFLEEMKLPIPLFNKTNLNNTGVTYLWIGNTPNQLTQSYRNKRLLSNQHNLLGCVESVTSDRQPVKLVSTGIRSGSMIESSCNPVCRTNPCYNNASCVERWRQRFVCQCGLSNFVGKHCNESYGVEFNGHLYVDIAEQIKMQKFQIAFKKLKGGNYQEVSKVFSIEFIFNQSLNVYINVNGYLNIKFIGEYSYTIGMFVNGLLT